MPSWKEPEEGDEPEPRAGGRRRRLASRRHRALVPLKEPPLEEEGSLDATVTNIAEYTQSRGRKDLHRARLSCYDQKPLPLESPSAPIPPLELPRNPIVAALVIRNNAAAVDRRCQTVAALTLYYSVLLCSASASGSKMCVGTANGAAVFGDFHEFRH
ncbi:hypothetical protein AHAS_Ahas14G0132700 [Arachis hypogaea]